MVGIVEETSSELVGQTHSNVVERYQLKQVAELIARFEELEQRPANPTPPVLPKWVTEVLRKVQQLECQVASPPMPVLPDWQPEVPARLRQLKFMTSQPRPPALPEGVRQVPRRLEKLERSVAQQVQAVDQLEAMLQAAQTPAALPKPIATLRRRFFLP